MYDQMYLTKLVFFCYGYNVVQCLIIYYWKISVILTVPYHLYFLCVSKVWSMLPTAMYFYHFHFFFWWSIKFLQQNINQSEAKTDDTKLSVELYE